jgi:Ca-activated chloride channel family protein
MKFRLQTVFILLVIFSMISASCSSINSLGKRVTVLIVYGSEKQSWLEPLAEAYNAARNQTPNGSVITIETIPMGSIESVNAIIDGSLQPTVWSPASSVYIPVANAEWRQTHTDDLVVGSPKDLVLSPVVIAMWRPMAEALGWPTKALGWSDVAELATSDEGWEAYGYPEWGDFKFGHTHPSYSNSGIVSIIAQAYAGAGKQRGLTLEDLGDPELKAFVADVQTSIIHYGTSTGFFGTRMFERGPSYLSAAVLYENLIVEQETKRLAGQSFQNPVVAIYPKEGTFWSNHPYAVINAPWVTEEQKAAAEKFQDFLLEKPQQIKALEYGFRPADVSIPLTAPLDTEHGVDISQPKTILEVPSAEVTAGILALWKEVKKPVDLVVVMDISGSMGGEKIAAARNSLKSFISLLDDRDRLEVIVFSTQLSILTDLSELGSKRTEITNRVSGVIEGGGTRVYDATLMAFQELEAKGNPKHIRAVIVLSDGQDTDSVANLREVKDTIGIGPEEGGNAPKLFTIAFGSDADTDVLKELAEITGGKQYSSDPESINQVYSEIATFF